VGTLVLGFAAVAASDNERGGNKLMRLVIRTRGVGRDSW
jgi:hypothetical protein